MSIEEPSSFRVNCISTSGPIDKSDRILDRKRETIGIPRVESERIRELLNKTEENNPYEEFVYRDEGSYSIWLTADLVIRNQGTDTVLEIVEHRQFGSESVVWVQQTPLGKHSLNFDFFLSKREGEWRVFATSFFGGGGPNPRKWQHFANPRPSCK